MMKRTSLHLVALAAALAAAACGFEHERGGPLAPSSTQAAPALTPPTTSSSVSMMGVWGSQSITPPSPSTCTNFQWRVTSQTATSLQGEFFAECAAGLSITGTASGQLVNGTVPLTVSGTASMPGIPGCSFSLSGTGTIEDNNNTLRIPFSGITCLGPVQGTEVLRRRVDPPPPPPAPEPTPAPPSPALPPANGHHVAPGPLTEDHASLVVHATAREFPHLTAVFGSEADAVAAADQLLQRTIWHLRLLGYDAARQRNPSGAISSDKLAIVFNGGWHAYDIYSLGGPGRATTVHPHIYEVALPNPVPHGGIPD